MTNFTRPSLTREQLQEISQRRRNPAPGDVQALLWEIARLRAIAVRADQYLLGPSSFLQGVLRRELDDCASVQEQKIIREEFLRKG